MGVAQVYLSRATLENTIATHHGGPSLVFPWGFPDASHEEGFVSCRLYFFRTGVQLSRCVRSLESLPSILEWNNHICSRRSAIDLTLRDQSSLEGHMAAQNAG